MDTGLTFYGMIGIVLCLEILNGVTKVRDKEFEKRLNERLTQIEQKIGER